MKYLLFYKIPGKEKDIKLFRFKKNALSFIKLNNCDPWCLSAADKEGKVVACSKGLLVLHPELND